ncbi:short coiled-coil protein B [Hydra vulgaris]|uniref:Short coiled-coil protein B n=1 Tax=Hydra vulgaris TaxID=6087 RepID=A0ABM4BN76_HYDVU
MESISLSSDDENTKKFTSTHKNQKPIQTSSSLDSDDLEEKSRLIQQVFQLQNTLDDLSQRVDAVKDENTKLKSENQILGQYIENLMAASNVFQGSKVKSKPEKQVTKK